MSFHFMKPFQEKGGMTLVCVTVEVLVEGTRQIFCVFIQQQAIIIFYNLSITSPSLPHAACHVHQRQWTYGRARVGFWLRMANVWWKLLIPPKEVFIGDSVLLEENAFQLSYGLNALIENDLKVPYSGHPFSEIVMLSSVFTLIYKSKERKQFQ